MNFINRRHFLHFNVLKLSNITEKPVKTSNLHKNEYKSKSYPFKYTTIIKDATNVVVYMYKLNGSILFQKPINLMITIMKKTLFEFV